MTASPIEFDLDLLLLGATVVTMDPAQPLLHDAAIGIRGNRLAFVGRAQELPVQTRARTTRQLAGRVIGARLRERPYPRHSDNGARRR